MNPDLLTWWKNKWLMWKDRPEDFRRFLLDIQDSLGIKNQFVDHAPISLIGNWNETRNKVFVGSLNPSSKIKKEFHSWESKERGFDYPDSKRVSLTWEKQLDFCQNFFLKLIANPENLSISHYTRIGTFFSYYNNRYPLSKVEKYQLLHDQAVFGEIIPYYSPELLLSPGGDESILAEHWNIISSYIRKSGFSTFILSGLTAYKIFQDKGWIIPVGKAVEVKSRSKTSSLQIVKIDGFHGILIPFIRNIPNEDFPVVVKKLIEARKINEKA